ncbi:hypothetical protein BOS5A_200917 [Bosea sp. EC-HK365B]|nr:hypothetical protein BOSE7B_40347 [Bosea sp. 7B]VVT59050.1 hypothetical protein BOS5A_200917 [Bosea sp. EC-HK365B]VXC77395.1 hypothetical protein BOSE127_50054 [Bosea sp. 127]
MAWAESSCYGQRRSAGCRHLGRRPRHTHFESHAERPHRHPLVDRDRARRRRAAPAFGGRRPRHGLGRRRRRRRLHDRPRPGQCADPRHGDSGRPVLHYLDRARGDGDAWPYAALDHRRRPGASRHDRSGGPERAFRAECRRGARPAPADAEPRRVATAAAGNPDAVTGMELGQGPGNRPFSFVDKREAQDRPAPTRLANRTLGVKGDLP